MERDLHGYGCNENVFEFLTNQKEIYITLSQGRYKTRFKDMAKKYPEFYQVLDINQDGSVYGKMNISLFSPFRSPRSLTAEQREILTAILQKARSEKA